MKGQSAVELTMVIGMALILSSPFMLSAQSSAIQLKEASESLQLDDSIKKLENNARYLKQKTYPARRNIRFSTPGNVERVYGLSFPNRSALIFQINSRGQPSNRSVIFDFNTSLHNGGRLEDEGYHDVVLRKNPRGVNISVIS